MNMYEARWENAKKLCYKIKKFIDEGYLVFDSDDNRISAIIITNESVSYTVEGNSNALYNLYINDSELDNGALDTIKEWNSKFKEWAIIHPKNIEKLLRRVNEHYFEYRIR